MPFAAFVAVEGYGKTVYFVLYLCHQAEECAVLLESYAFAVAAYYQLCGAVATIFYEACYGYVKVQLVFYYLAYGLHLSFAAIGEYQVG